MADLPNMPDVTKGQIGGILTAIASAAIAFGAPISQEQSLAIVGIGGAVAATVVGADAHIRGKRAEHIGAVMAQAVAAPPPSEAEMDGLLDGEVSQGGDTVFPGPVVAPPSPEQGGDVPVAEGGDTGATVVGVAAVLVVLAGAYALGRLTGRGSGLRVEVRR